MLEFDATPVRFTVRGGKYFLDPLTLDDASTMSEQANASTREQIQAMVAMIASKARTRTPLWWLRVTGRPTPSDAVKQLSPPQQAQLFGDWIREYRGVGLGESLGSADSRSSTPTA